MVSIPELLKVYDELNSERGILFPLAASEAMCETVSSDCCKYKVDQNPERFDWFCNVDPRATNNTPNVDILILLSQYQAMDAKGVGS